jgi:hypothetical protein
VADGDEDQREDDPAVEPEPACDAWCRESRGREQQRRQCAEQADVEVRHGEVGPDVSDDR